MAERLDANRRGGTAHYFQCVRTNNMEHSPSTYKTTVELNFQQIVAVHQAICTRIAHLLFDDEAKEHLSYRQQDVVELLEVAAMLSAHQAIAVNEWEENVAKTEAKALDDDGAVGRFLEERDSQ
jgi:hypothetical protein